MDAAEALAKVAEISKLSADDVRGMNVLAAAGDAEALADTVRGYEVRLVVPSRSTWDEIAAILGEVEEFAPLAQALLTLLL